MGENQAAPGGRGSIFRAMEETADGAFLKGGHSSIMALIPMCRSIKVLRRPDEQATPDEISAAALQFVRKVSGSQKPSKVNQTAFEAAVREIAAATDKLLKELPSRTGATRTEQPL